MIKLLYIFTISALIMLNECNSPQKILHLENDNNGQRIKVDVNGEITLSLDANPTTGYRWTVSKINNNILQQSQKVEFKPQSKKMGAPGKQIFRFSPKKDGKSELELIYHRPWEKDVAPIDTFRVEVIVKK